MAAASPPAMSRATQSGKPLPAPPPVKRPDVAARPSSPPFAREEDGKHAEQPSLTESLSTERRLHLDVPPSESTRGLSPIRSATRAAPTKRVEHIDTLVSCQEEKLRVQLKIEGESCMWEVQGELTPEAAQELVALLTRRPRAQSIDSKKGSIIRRDKKDKDKRGRGDSVLRGLRLSGASDNSIVPLVSQPVVKPALSPIAPPLQVAFGVPLETLLENQKERYPYLRIPHWIASAFDLFMRYIVQRALAVEGVFRLSGSQTQVNDLRDKLNRGEDVNWGQLLPDVHIVTGLVKLFLRELPEPLLMTKYYPHLMACVNIEVAEQQRAAVGEIVQTLPASHLHLLMELLTVCRVIAANSDLNKMTIDNLARLIGPNIIRTKSTITDLTKLHAESENVNRIAYLLLENYQRFFGDLSGKMCETDEQPNLRFYCRHWAPVSVVLHALGYVWVADAAGVVRAHSPETGAVVHEVMPAKGAVNALAATEGTRVWIATETMMLIYALKPTGPPQLEREIAVVCSSLCVVEKVFGVTRGANPGNNSGLVWAATSAGAVQFTLSGEQGGTLAAPAALPRCVAATLTSIFISSSGSVMCFSILSPTDPPTSLALHNGPIRSLAIGPDGQTLVSAGADGRMTFTNVISLHVEEQSEQSAPIITATLHPDGGFAYAITATGVRVWQVGEAQMVREVEAYFPAPPSAALLFRRSAPGSASLWVIQGQVIYEWIVRSPTRRPTRHSRPQDLTTPVMPIAFEQQHTSARVPPTLQLTRNTSASRLKQQLTNSSSSPSPPLSPERASGGSAAPPSPNVSAPMGVHMRRGSSAGRLRDTLLSPTSRGSQDSVSSNSPPTSSPASSASLEEPKPVQPLPNNGTFVKRVQLEGKEGIHVMALFQNRIILGGAEGSLYICDQSGAILDVKSKAHQSAVSALLCVGTQLWSGSDDGMLHTWEMKERSLAEKVGSRVGATVTVKKKEGPLTKYGKKSHYRWYVLRGEELFFYANKNDKTPKGSIQLAGARCEKLEVRDNPKKKEYFLCIGTGMGKIVQLAAASEEERNAWVSALDAALKICNDRIFAHVLAKRQRKGIAGLATIGNKVLLICKEDAQVSVFDPVTMTRTDVVAPSLPDGSKNTVTRVVTCQKTAWVVTGERFLWQAPAAAVAVKTEHVHPIFSLATTHQDQLVSISRDRLCLWDPRSASPLRTVDLRLPLVYHAEVINIWNADWTFQKEMDQSVHGCNGAITFLLPMPDGSVWSSSKDGSLVLWR